MRGSLAPWLLLGLAMPSCARAPAPPPRAPPLDVWAEGHACPAPPDDGSTHAAACDAGVLAACGALAQSTASPIAQRQLEKACDADDGCACAWLADSVAVRDDAETMLDLLERSCRAGAREGCDLLIVVVSLGCQNGDPRSCRIVEEQGLGDPEEASSPPATPSPTDQCQEVFRLVMAQVDAKRIYVESPAAQCAPAVRSWTAHADVRPWRASDRAERRVRCPGDCGPDDGVRVTVTPQGECFHVARRSGTGGSFATYCWSGGAMVMRDAGVW